MTDVPFYDLGSLMRSRRSRIHAVVDRVLDVGYFVGGPSVDRFEAEWAAYHGTRHAIGVGNGLDALRLVLEAKGIGAGDEVIVPAFTFYASALAVLQTGATPVLVDVDSSTALMDASAVQAAVSGATRAVMPVHLYGGICDVASIAAAVPPGTLIVEDAAQAHGAHNAGGIAGSQGGAGAFSFYPTKNLGALGDGGAIVTDDDEIAASVRSRRSYGQGNSKYEHVDTGWNSRLDPLQAEILLDEIEDLKQWNARRAEIAGIYLDALGDAEHTVIGSNDREGRVWHHFVIRAADRDGARDALRRHGVATDVHYPYALGGLDPIIGSARLSEPTPVAEALAREVLSLPIGPWMRDDQVEHVASVLERISAAGVFA